MFSSSRKVHVPKLLDALLVTVHTSVTCTGSIRYIFFHIFKRMECNKRKYVLLSNRAIFNNLNINLLTTNSIAGSMIPGALKTYTSADLVFN